MAAQDSGFDVDFPVGGSALSQFQLVKLSGTDLVVSAAVTDDCIGVIQDGASANAANAKVRVTGVTFALAHDGSISKGDPLMAEASGRVDGHDGTTANPIIGYALEDSGAQDDEIRILLGAGLRAGPAA